MIWLSRDTEDKENVYVLKNGKYAKLIYNMFKNKNMKRIKMSWDYVLTKRQLKICFEI